VKQVEDQVEEKIIEKKNESTKEENNEENLSLRKTLDRTPIPFDKYRCQITRTGTVIRQLNNESDTQFIEQNPKNDSNVPSETSEISKLKDRLIDLIGDVFSIENYILEEGNKILQDKELFESEKITV